MAVPYGRQSMLIALFGLTACSLLAGYLYPGLQSGEAFLAAEVRSAEAVTRDQFLLHYEQGLDVFPSLAKLKRRKRLPDLIGIGFKKCGTGGLVRMLSKHPLARVSIPNELHYFDRYRFLGKNVGIESYIEMMPEAYDFELVAEKSPNYVVSPLTQPQDMRDLVPNAKLFVVLCDPINRTLSDFVHESRHGHIEKGMSYDTVVRRNIVNLSRMLPALGTDTAVQNFLHQDLGYEQGLLGKGLYYYHLQRWLQVYNRSEIFIADGERLLTDPWSVMDEFQDFLGLPRLVLKEDFVKNPASGFYCVMLRKRVHRGNAYLLVNGRTQCFNSSVKGRTRLGASPYTPSAGTVELIRRFFAPHNKKLFKLLGKKFNWM